MGLISIIIPTRNEPLIQDLVSSVHAEFKGLDHEVVVVDKSDQPLVIENARVIVQEGTGLGRAIVQGLERANGTWVAVMDGDFSHRPEDLARMVRSVNGYDLVLGSRYVKGGENGDSRLRRIVSRLFNRFAQLVLGLNYKDPMSGLILARKEIFDEVHPNPIGFKINLEIIYKASRLGYLGGEVPIRFVPRAAGRSKAGVSEGVRTLSYIISLRFQR